MNSNDLLNELLTEQKQTNQWLQYIAGYSKQTPETPDTENEAYEGETRELARTFLYSCLVGCQGKTVQETREHILNLLENCRIDVAGRTAVKELFEIEVAHSTFNTPSLNALTGKEEPE